MNKISINEWKNRKFEIETIKNGTSDDLFISHVNYECRTVGTLKKFSTNYKADTGVFFMEEKFSESGEVQKNRIEINNILKCSSFFDYSEYFPSSIENPIRTIIEVNKIIKNRFASRQNLNITLDITTFPKGELLTLVYYLLHLPRVNSLRILYISPTKYGDWLSRGYKYSMIPPFFEGPPTFHKKTALLILTGFDLDVAISLIDDIEPSYLILGRPNPGTSDEFKDVSEEIVSRLKRIRRITEEISDIPANDPFSCRDALGGIIQKKSQSYDFFVAIMGTKLEVLGAYLAYEKNQDFRIIYPVPLIYNVKNYSSGCRDIYEIFLRGGNNSGKQSENI